MASFVGLLLSLVFALAPLGQATPQPSEEPPIPPVVWELIEMAPADGEMAEIEEPSRYTVQFLPEGELSIRADCNQVVGTYSVNEDAIDLTLSISTLALCPPDSLERPFQDLLESAATFEIDADGVLYLSGDGGSLRLRPALQGVVWEWQEFQDMNDDVIFLDDPENYTVEFLAEDKLAIRADCNRATGTYTVDGPAVDLKIGGVTRAMCPPGSLFERYLRDLDEVSSHVFRDGNLFLALPMDSGILMFTARYVEPSPATPEAG